MKKTYDLTRSKVKNTDMFIIIFENDFIIYDEHKDTTMFSDEETELILLHIVEETNCGAKLYENSEQIARGKAKEVEAKYKIYTINTEEIYNNYNSGVYNAQVLQP